MLSNGSIIFLLLPLKYFNGFLTVVEKLPCPLSSRKSLKNGTKSLLAFNAA